MSHQHLLPWITDWMLEPNSRHTTERVHLRDHFYCLLALHERTEYWHHLSGNNKPNEPQRALFGVLPSALGFLLEECQHNHILGKTTETPSFSPPHTITLPCSFLMAQTQDCSILTCVPLRRCVFGSISLRPMSFSARCFKCTLRNAYDLWYHCFSRIQSRS